MSVSAPLGTFFAQRALQGRRVGLHCRRLTCVGGRSASGAAGQASSGTRFGCRRTGNPVRIRDGPAAVTEQNREAFCIEPLIRPGGSRRPASRMLGSQKTYQRVACGWPRGTAAASSCLYGLRLSIVSPALGGALNRKRSAMRLRWHIHAPLRGGMTLVELLVVVAIIGVLAGTVVAGGSGGAGGGAAGRMPEQFAADWGGAARVPRSARPISRGLHR